MNTQREIEVTSDIVDFFRIMGCVSINKDGLHSYELRGVYTETEHPNKFLLNERKSILTEEDINDLIIKGDINPNLINDKYHTFPELYEFRKLYNAALFNEWAKEIVVPQQNSSTKFAAFPKYDVHKSWRHYDGELCFGGGWFIVVAILPTGQISNHYKEGDWDLFKIPESPTAKYEFDGHTPKDVINRLKSILK